MLHPLADPLLTSVFALIEPTVIVQRGEPPEAFGYGSEHRIDLASHYSSISQSLHHAAGALGVAPPPTYENTNDPGGLSFLHSFDPAVVLGNAALHADVPSQAAAFISARHLCYLRPGLYLRQLIGTGTGLKSWLSAAIKLTVPQFPVAPELEGPISDALAVLKGSMQASARDHLTRVVSKLLQSGAALDLKSWIAGVDLTADRAGLLLANDLGTAAEILEVSDETTSAVGPKQRFEELVLYSVSPEYLALRKQLGRPVRLRHRDGARDPAGARARAPGHHRRHRPPDHRPAARVRRHRTARPEDARPGQAAAALRGAGALQREPGVSRLAKAAWHTGRGDSKLRDEVDYLALVFLVGLGRRLRALVEGRRALVSAPGVKFMRATCPLARQL